MSLKFIFPFLPVAFSNSHSLPIKREWDFQFPFPFPGAKKPFPLTPGTDMGSAMGRSWGWSLYVMKCLELPSSKVPPPLQAWGKELGSYKEEKKLKRNSKKILKRRQRGKKCYSGAADIGEWWSQIALSAPSHPHSDSSSLPLHILLRFPYIHFQSNET